MKHEKKFIAYKLSKAGVFGELMALNPVAQSNTKKGLIEFVSDLPRKYETKIIILETITLKADET